jgi:hypothetical protein
MRRALGSISSVTLHLNSKFLLFSEPCEFGYFQSREVRPAFVTLEGQMNMWSPRLRAFSEESQKLKDKMLEIQRLRRLVNLAEAERKTASGNFGQQGTTLGSSRCELSALHPDRRFAPSQLALHRRM